MDIDNMLAFYSIHTHTHTNTNTHTHMYIHTKYTIYGHSHHPVNKSQTLLTLTLFPHTLELLTDAHIASEQCTTCTTLQGALL